MTGKTIESRSERTTSSSRDKLVHANVPMITGYVEVVVAVTVVVVNVIDVTIAIVVMGESSLDGIDGRNDWRRLFCYRDWSHC